MHARARLLALQAPLPAGHGHYRCEDGGYEDYSSMLSACDAATGAPTFYVRGAAVVAINYNLIFLLISLEFFRCGVFDVERSMRRCQLLVLRVAVASLWCACCALSASSLCLLSLPPLSASSRASPDRNLPPCACTCH